MGGRFWNGPERGDCAHWTAAGGGAPRRAARVTAPRWARRFSVPPPRRPPPRCPAAPAPPLRRVASPPPPCRMVEEDRGEEELTQVRGAAGRWAGRQRRRQGRRGPRGSTAITGDERGRQQIKRQGVWGGGTIQGCRRGARAPPGGARPGPRRPPPGSAARWAGRSGPLRTGRRRARTRGGPRGAGGRSFAGAAAARGGALSGPRLVRLRGRAPPRRARRGAGAARRPRRGGSSWPRRGGSSTAAARRGAGPRRPRGRAAPGAGWAAVVGGGVLQSYVWRSGGGNTGSGGPLLLNARA
jgi:hypothetical protein